MLEFSRRDVSSWRASRARLTQEMTSLSRQWDVNVTRKPERRKEIDKKEREKEVGDLYDSTPTSTPVRWQHEGFSLNSTTTFRCANRWSALDLPAFPSRVVCSLFLFRSDTRAKTCSRLSLMKTRGGYSSFIRSHNGHQIFQRFKRSCSFRRWSRVSN